MKGSPSHVHQALLLWAARRMQTDGFFVAGFDGTAEQGRQWSALPKPFLLNGRRPDAWGQTSDASLLAFAEAKTAGDILSEHTAAQLRTFGNIRMRTSWMRCPLYIAVPREQAAALDKALAGARLLSAAHVLRLYVPEVLLRETGHAA
jgi:hypothetical protein